MQGSQKVLYNSMLLYGRLFLSAIIGIFSTRIVLQNLGVNDYGIYNLIVGVIGMFSVLNGAMGVSTQRFLSHTMGTGDYERLKKVFSTSLAIHLILGFSIAVLLGLVGQIIITDYLNLPADRINVASSIFLLVVFSTFIDISATPFDGSLVANENFLIIAVAELLFSLILLGSAIYISYTGYDKLMAYAIITTSGIIAIALFKVVYCVRKYYECSFFPRYFEKRYFKEMLSFAGWNLFGALCGLARGQGLAVIMNIYFGVRVNAAYGVASQVNGQVNSLSSVVTKAIYPQLMKSEGKGDRDRMFRLSVLTSKIPFILMSMLGIPLIIEMEFVLDIWLKDVPQFTTSLAILLIVLSLISTLSYGLIAAVQSIGKIKIYQVVTGTLLILGLPVAVVFFKLGFGVIWALVIALAFEVVAHFFRLLFLKRIASISVPEFFKEVDLKLISIAFMGFAASSWLLFLEPGFIRLGCVIFTSSITIIAGTYLILLNKKERVLIHSLFNKALNRMHNANK